MSFDPTAALKEAGQLGYFIGAYCIQAELSGAPNADKRNSVIASVEGIVNDQANPVHLPAFLTSGIGATAAEPVERLAIGTGVDVMVSLLDHWGIGSFLQSSKNALGNLLPQVS